MGMPVSPLEPTSSSISFSQSATTLVRVPGCARISFSVLMGGYSISLPRSVVPIAVRQQHPGLALGILTGLNVLNYLDRYVPAAVLPLIIAELAISDGQAGSLQSAFILTYTLMSLAGRLASATGPAALLLAAVGVAVWSAGHRSAPAWPGASRLCWSPAPGRRRRGQLRRRHALADLRSLSGRPPRPGPGHLLRGHPAGQRARLHAGRADRGAATAGARRSSSPVARACCWRCRCWWCASRRAGASTRPPLARRAARWASRCATSGGAPELRRQHRRPDHLHVHHRRPGLLDADLLRAGARHPARAGRVPVRGGAQRGRLAGHAHRRPGGRSPGPPRRQAAHFSFSGWALVASAALHPAGGPGAPACYLLAGDVRDPVAAVPQHRPAERRDGQRPAARAARASGFADLHGGHPPVRRLPLAHAHRRWSPTASGCGCRCWSPACCWCRRVWCCCWGGHAGAAT